MEGDGSRSTPAVGVGGTAERATCSEAVSNTVRTASNPIAITAAASAVAMRNSAGTARTSAIDARPTGHSRPAIRTLNGTQNTLGSVRRVRMQTSDAILRI